MALSRNPSSIVSLELINRAMKLMPHRRWFQWSLRGLMLLFVFVAIGAAWFNRKAINAERQQVAAATFRKHYWDFQDNVADADHDRMRTLIKDCTGRDIFYAIRKAQVIEGDGVGEFRQVLPDLTSLEKLDLFQVVQLTIKDCEQISKLTNLADLYLAGTNITDEHLKPLANCPKLVRLGLSFTETTDQGLMHLGRIKTLEELHFTSTKITDAGLKELGGLSKLQTLDLGSTFKILAPAI